MSTSGHVLYDAFAAVAFLPAGLLDEGFGVEVVWVLGAVFGFFVGFLVAGGTHFVAFGALEVGGGGGACLGGDDGGFVVPSAAVGDGAVDSVGGCVFGRFFVVEFSG